MKCLRFCILFFSNERKILFFSCKQINFDEWFSKQLIHEINLKGDNFRIIRRRAIWLIGQWTGVKFDRNLRPKVYDLCLQLLQPDEDMSVRLAAAS